MPEPFFSIENLKISFATKKGKVLAIDGVSLEVKQGECLGVVGESGSGKSVTFYSALGLLRPPGKVESGKIIFDGKNLLSLSDVQMRKLRGKDIAITLQDALTSLNPVLTVGTQLMETIYAHSVSNETSAKTRAIEIMKMVGIPSPEKRLNQYPHEFSGGMRQRIMVAIALVCKPRLLIADEPTTALDVTIQAQVMELIHDMRRELGMSVVLITHDLGVVAEYCDRVAVMYAGQIVEQGTAQQIIHNPRHPYTRGLLASIPDMQHPEEPLWPMKGQIPDLSDIGEECRFYARCPYVADECRKPVAIRELEGGRMIRCILKEGATS